MTKVNKKPTPWQPSKQMLKAMEVAQNMEGRVTVTGLCQEAGVDRSTYYQWWDKPEFCEWWHKTYELHMERSMWLLNKISYVRSLKDYRYMEMLQMKYAKFRKSADITSDHKRVRVILGDKSVDANPD